MNQDFSWTRSASKYMDLYRWMHPEVPVWVPELEEKPEEIVEEPKTDEAAAEQPKAEEVKAPEAEAPAAKPAPAKKPAPRKTAAKKPAAKPAAEAVEAAKEETMKKYYGNYLLMIEGSLPTKDEAYCCVGGKSALQITEEAAAGAKAIIAWGNCASAGCVQAANPNPTGAKGIHKVIKGKPIINVQGCPPIADVMAGVIIYMLTFERMPQLDGLGRPKMFYSRRVHDTCYRRANFDAGLFVESFDDENAKHGYCLYKVGCKGPSTYNSCGIIKWNEGTSYPIQSGHPCLGCSEENFWDNSPFYKRMPDIHGFGIEATADQIGLALGAATAAGIAVHAVATNIRKKELIDNDEPESKSTI